MPRALPIPHYTTTTNTRTHTHKHTHTHTHTNTQTLETIPIDLTRLPKKSLAVGPKMGAHCPVSAPCRGVMVSCCQCQVPTLTDVRGPGWARWLNTAASIGWYPPSLPQPTSTLTQPSWLTPHPYIHTCTHKMRLRSISTANEIASQINRSPTHPGPAMGAPIKGAAG